MPLGASMWQSPNWLYFHKIEGKPEAKYVCPVWGSLKCKLV